MIDVVGHLGSRLSYATIADQLVMELTSRNALGTITNLDDQFLRPELAGLTGGAPRGEKVLLLADPQDHLVDALVGAYGAPNVAIFVCPNTDRLSEDRTRACATVGKVYTPSSWCAQVIWNSLEKLDLDAVLGGPTLVEVKPLGVDRAFTSQRLSRQRRTPSPTDPISMLHVTTDTFWPGRKGTEELLQAWKSAFPNRRLAPACLTVHCLPRLLPAIHQELGDLGLTDDVQLISSPPRGSTEDELGVLFSKFDLLVAPSRSEGFGVMPLSALLSGLPVLTTADTGQAEYLCARRYSGAADDVGHPLLGGWLQIPTTGRGSLFGEDGEAPMLRPDQLALSLVAGARLYDELLVRTSENNHTARVEWSWEYRRQVWAQSLIEWSER